MRGGFDSLRPHQIVNPQLNQTKMKKSSKSFLAIIALSLATAGFVFAAATESKVAGCCKKAQDAGKACDHPCCVAAAKDGNNCEKCKGSGKIEKATAKK